MKSNETCFYALGVVFINFTAGFSLQTKPNQNIYLDYAQRTKKARSKSSGPVKTTLFICKLSERNQQEVTKPGFQRSPNKGLCVVFSGSS